MALADAQAPGPEDARLRAELERLRAELASERGKARSYFERLEALRAEFEEHRSRVEREREEEREGAKRGLILRMLEVTDSLDRAIEFAGGDEVLHDALVSILRQTRAILEREGLQRIEAEGRPYNPEVHEAVMQEETTEYRDGFVVKELGKGYTLRGKVLRKAKVKVAVNRPGS